MAKTLTLHPAYVTPHKVCFKEDGATTPVARTTAYNKAATPDVFLGSQYFTVEQLEELGWKPEAIGDEYETAPDKRGKTYTRADVTGPSIAVTFKVVA